MEAKAVLLFILQFHLRIITATVFSDSTSSRSVNFVTREDHRLIGHVVEKIKIPSLISCSQKCLTRQWCTSINFDISAIAKQGGKGTCELNSHDISVVNENSKLQHKKGVVFSMLLKTYSFQKKGCQMTPCLNNGICFFDDNKQTFACSCKKPWTGDRCEVKEVDKCGYPNVCAYVHDPCPPGYHNCDHSCSRNTNKCCCR